MTALSMFWPGSTTNGMSSASTPFTRTERNAQPGGEGGVEDDTWYRPGATPARVNVAAALTLTGVTPIDTDSGCALTRLTRTMPGFAGGCSVVPVMVTFPDTVIPGCITSETFKSAPFTLTSADAHIEADDGPPVAAGVAFAPRTVITNRPGGTAGNANRPCESSAALPSVPLKRSIE